jgi:WhiB family transcriptional regulator, redox-sensing transcriptional regulator
MTATAVGERVWRAPVEPSRDPRAACRGVDPELFFPGSDESAEPALRVCRSCPIEADCLAWALAKQETWGVWGGTTERRRRQILRARARGVQPAASSYGEIVPLAETYLRGNPGVAFTPTQVARAIGKHPRSVETAVKRLVTTGRARLVGQRPRRYAAPGTGPVTVLPDSRAQKGDLMEQVRRYVQAHPDVEHTAPQIAAALPDFNAMSIGPTLARLAARGELRQLPGPGRATRGQPARYALAHNKDDDRPADRPRAERAEREGAAA